jgi:hypothetical protein
MEVLQFRLEHLGLVGPHELDEEDLESPVLREGTWR